MSAMQHFSIKGYDMAFIAEGQGQPLLLIHGSLYDYRYWAPLIEFFAAAGFRVFAPSLRHYWPNDASGAARLSIEEQIEDIVMGFVGITVWLIYFIDHHNRLFTEGQGFLQHETGLWHRTFEGIHQQQYTIGHVQHTFYLSTKIRVTGGINDVDFRTFPLNTHVFGQNGDTALAFQIVVIEDQLPYFLIITEQTGLV
jgi:hypothetical protein